jgi:hypothetical protein
LPDGSGRIFVFDPSIGEIEFVIDDIVPYMSVQLADIDGDSTAEIVAVVEGSWNGSLASFNASGELRWRSEENYWSRVFGPLITDLDVNGDPEIFIEGKLQDGASGRLIAEFDGLDYGSQNPAVGDLDGDGYDEIFVGDCLRDEHLMVEWCVDGSVGDGAPLVVDIDGDGVGELILIEENYQIYSAEGELLSSVPLSCRNQSTPAVADFDGDGEAEIAFSILCGSFPDYSIFVVLSETDGAVYATLEVFDHTMGAINPIGWDVDGDGAYEVLVCGGESFFILDGSTLAVLAEYSDFISVTLYDYPTVADVDGDGSAEIVLVSSYNWFDATPGALLVLGHAHNAWPAAGPAWPVWDYDGVNVRSDGTLAPGPRRPWDHGNRVRARPAASSPDLRPEIAGLCVGACTREGRARIAWRVANEGAGPATGGFEVRVYARAMTGLDRKLLGSFEVSERVVEGRTVEGVYEFGLEGLDPGRGLLIGLSVDDDGAGGRSRECDEADNEVWAPLACEQE